MSNSPLVLIPGLLSDRTVWQGVIDMLGDNYQCRVPELFDFENLTVMAEYVLDINSGMLAVAGHSMGARVAMEMSRIAPDRVERLALLDAGAHPRNETEHVGRLKLVELGQQHGMQAVANQWLPPMMNLEQPGSSEVMNKLEAMVMRMNPEIHRRQIQALLDRPDATTYIPTIQCPTLVALGRQDFWAPVKAHEEIHVMLPNSHLEIIENAGHFLPVEQVEETSRILRYWLTN
jgi:pimeloyl-ACP methyl ester carboxylesterase